MSHTARVDLKIPNGGQVVALNSVWSKGQCRIALGGATQVNIIAPVAALVKVAPSYKGTFVDLLDGAGTAIALKVGMNQLPLFSGFDDLQISTAAPVGADQTFTVTLEIC